MKIRNESDFQEADIKLELKKIPTDEIKIKEVDDLWDGPLVGSCLQDNTEYYFYCFDQVLDDGSGDRWPRKYLLIKLNRDQNEEVQRERKSFLDYKSGVIAQKDYLKILEHFPTQLVDKSQVVGWFDSGELSLKSNKFMASYFDWQKMNP